MKITYKNTVEDMICLAICTLNNNPSTQKRIKSIRIGLPIFIMIIFLTLSFKNGFTPVFSTFCISIALVWIIFYPKIFQWKIKQETIKTLNNSKNKSLLANQELTLTKEGITKEKEGETLKISWSNIKNIDVTTKHICIYIASINVIIIPLSAFKDEAEKKEFLDILYKHIK